MKTMVRLSQYTIVILLLVALAACFTSGKRSVTTTGAVIASGTATAKDIVQDPDSSKTLFRDPSVVTGELANGFRYILKKNYKPEGRVSMHLNVQSGSVHEKEGQQGVAHYLEHMLFNGSEHFPPGELVRYFQRIGMQFGADANAHTGYYETVYDILLPSGERKSFDEGLIVFQDYASGALLLEEEVQREKKIILAEKRDRDSAAYRMFLETLDFEIPDMRISKRPPIGTESVIESANRPLLKSYYDTWYRPDKMVLIVVGDIDIKMAEERIRERFASLVPRAPGRPEPDPGQINHHGVKPFYFYEEETGKTSVTIETLGRREHQKETLPDIKNKVKVNMANTIVQNRLDGVAQQPEPPFSDASAASGTFLKYIDYAVISAECSPGKWDRALKTMDQQLRQALQFGFFDSELERVKKDYVARLTQNARAASTRDSTDIARRITQAVNDDQLFFSPKQQADLLIPFIDALTTADVYDAFQESWATKHRLLLVTGNTKINDDTEKARSAIADVYQESQAVAVLPPVNDKQVVFPYLDTPTKGNVIAKNDIEDLDITTLTFENGLRLNLRQTDFKTNSLVYTLRFAGGKKEMPLNKPGIISLAESVMNESGLGKLNKEELQRALAGTNTSIHFTADESWYAYSGDSVPGEMKHLFQLLYAYIKDQGLSERSYQSVMEKYEQNHAELNQTVDGVMTLNKDRFFAGGDQRFGPPLIEEIRAVSYGELKAFVDTLLTGKKPELSIVGDFDKAEAIEYAGLYLGAPELFAGDDKHGGEMLASPPVFPSGQEKQIQADTKIDKGVIYVGYPTTDYWDIEKTRRLSLLSAVFSERLREVIREKTGAAYSPYAYNDPSLAYKDFGVFNVAVSVKPDQIDTVEAGIHQIADELVENGVSEDALERSLKPIVTSIRDMQKTNRYWLMSVLAGSREHPERFDWSRTFLSGYSGITKQDIDQYAAMYLQNKKSAVIKVVPTP